MFVGILFFLICLSSSSIAATFTVTTTADSGTGSLRWAVAQANNTSGPDTIVFNISNAQATFESGVYFWRIKPTTELPRITDPLIIDGTTQPTNETYNNPNGPEIEVDGSLIPPSSNGIFISASNCRVQGLSIRGFANGIFISQGAQYNTVGNNIITAGGSGIVIDGATTSHNVVKGNIFNTDRIGKTPVYSGPAITIGGGAQLNIVGGDTPGDSNRFYYSDGVVIWGTNTNSNEVKGNYFFTGGVGVQIKNGARFNVVGGNSPGKRNIFSRGYGIWISGTNTDQNRIMGNYIGTDAAGNSIPQSVLDRAAYGVKIDSGAQGNVVGGLNAGEGNVIGGCSIAGVYISGAGTNGNEVIGNYMGTNTAATPLGNRNGVFIGERGGQFNIIGPNNVIAYNNENGIWIYGATTNNNTITQNSIYSNRGKGIRVEGGANSGIMPPVIRRAAYYNSNGNNSVIGAAETFSIIEVFLAENTPDPSGQGEGKIFLGEAITDGTGNWLASFKGQSSGKITATARKNGNTSEFALNKDIEINSSLPWLTTIRVTDRTSGKNYTNERIVSVEVVSVGDNAEMIVSEDQYFTGGAWVPFQRISAYEITGPGEGLKTIYVKVRDAAGGESDPRSANITLDLTGPNPPVLSRPNEGEYIKTATPTFYWQRSSDNVTWVASYEIMIDGSQAVIGNLTSYTAPIAEGLHTWKVRACDQVGNWGAYSGTRSFIYDITPPSRPDLISPANGGTAIRQTLFEWAEAADNLSGVQYYKIWVDGSENYAFGNEYSWPTMLSYGLHTWKVRAVDNAGNEGSFSAEWTFNAIEGTPVTASTTIPITISVAENGLDLKISWDSDLYRTSSEQSKLLLYVLKGSFTNEINAWIKAETLPDEFDLSHAMDVTNAYIIHKNQIGAGETEVYYRAIRNANDERTRACLNDVLIASPAAGKKTLTLSQGMHQIAGTLLTNLDRLLENTVIGLDQADQLWIHKKDGSFLLPLSYGEKWPGSYDQFAGADYAVFELTGPSPKTITYLGKIYPLADNSIITYVPKYDPIQEVGAQNVLLSPWTPRWRLYSILTDGVKNVRILKGDDLAAEPADLSFHPFSIGPGAVGGWSQAAALSVITEGETNDEAYYTGDEDRKYTFRVEFIDGSSKETEIALKKTIDSLSPAQGNKNILCLILSNSQPVFQMPQLYFEFSSGEFIADLTVDGLCQMISADDYRSDPYSTLVTFVFPDDGNNIGRLNYIVIMPNFYDIWLQKGKNIQLSSILQELINGTVNYRNNSWSQLDELQKSNIRRLNRLLLEATYPQNCPINRAKTDIEILKSEDSSDDVWSLKYIKVFLESEVNRLTGKTDLINANVSVFGPFGYDANMVKADVNEYEYYAGIAQSNGININDYDYRAYIVMINPADQNIIGYYPRSYAAREYKASINYYLYSYNFDKLGNWYVSPNQINSTSFSQLARVAAHEYMHVLGAFDKYAGFLNADLSPVPNNTTSIMAGGGVSLSLKYFLLPRPPYSPVAEWDKAAAISLATGRDIGWRDHDKNGILDVYQPEYFVSPAGQDLRKRF